MKTILYANEIKGVSKKLGKKIQEEISGMEFEILNSVKSLSQKLYQPLNGISVIIIIISFRGELAVFQSLLSALENIRIILILPDRQSETVSSGVRLNPSFISYADNDVTDIVEVLKKIQKVTKIK